jgi:hypothetical protein
LTRSRTRLVAFVAMASPCVVVGMLVDIAA